MHENIIMTMVISGIWSTDRLKCSRFLIRPLDKRVCTRKYVLIFQPTHIFKLMENKIITNFMQKNVYQELCLILNRASFQGICLN